jgi:hypothetical protein
MMITPMGYRVAEIRHYVSRPEHLGRERRWLVSCYGPDFPDGYQITWDRKQRLLIMRPLAGTNECTRDCSCNQR